MKKKTGAIIISLGLVLFGQWLIFSSSGITTKIGLALLFFLAVFWLAEKKYFKIKVIVRNFLPLVLLLGLISFFSFEEVILLKQLMLFLVAFCFYLFYSRLGIPYQKEIAHQLTYYWLDISILVAIYLIALSIYQLVSVVGLELYYLVISLAIFGGLVFGYGLWARNIDRKLLWVFLTLFLLIIVEVFIVLSFWREAFPLYKAMILALLYYLFMGLLDVKLRGERLKKHYLGYLIFGLLIFVILIFTIDWRVFD